MQKRDDGNWEVIKPDAKRASAVVPTQAAGKKRATEIVANLGGGEVTLRKQDGKFRDPDTVARGNDPNPPRDQK